MVYRKKIVDSGPTINERLGIPSFEADTRTPEEAAVTQDYMESLTDPSFVQQLGEGFQNFLRYTANPVKLVGDVASAVAPKSAVAKTLPNTREDILEFRKRRMKAALLSGGGGKVVADEAQKLLTNSLINAGAAELGWLVPGANKVPGLVNLFRSGGKANVMADALQIINADIDKIKQGDAKEIAGTALNAFSAVSHLNNFDASLIMNRIKNWDNIGRADKIDVMKDMYNMYLSGLQQTQRKK